MTDLKYQNTACCWHEAGHAIAKITLGLPFTRIVISGFGDGEVEVEPGQLEPPLFTLVSTYAGPTAELRWLHGETYPLVDRRESFYRDHANDPQWFELDDNKCDYATIYTLRNRIGFTESPDFAESMARDIVERRWDDLSRLAVHLTQNGTTSLDEAWDVIRTGRVDSS
ncbi:hypothetical protein HX744_14470 [Pseudonocardia sp. ICBG1122]|nr:hypothetical protein [Pseudonocardia pini]